MAYAFISYQTGERHIAARVHEALMTVGIRSFMAHEHIQVSEEWRVSILNEISRCDIFVCVLSKAYLSSVWCIQESGIAAVRQGMTIIPLSIDGTTPPGFISSIQSTLVNPSSFWVDELIPGIAKHDLNLGFRLILGNLSKSRSFRGAEENFKPILPYIDRLSSEQGAELLRVSLGNSQVLHANLCAAHYLPPLARTYGHLLNQHEQEELNSVLNRYAT